MALTKVTSGVLADDAVGVAGLSATGTASASTFLRGDNAWASAAAGFEKYTVVTSSDATFALQSGTTKLIIEVQASGGIAGTSSSGGRTAGPGGGGAYARKLLSPMVDTDTLNITLGAAAGIAASGTTTSVASASGTAFTTITCVGGSGGTTSSGTYNGTGGAGGTLPTTGDFNVAGGSGGKGDNQKLSPVQGGAWLARINAMPSSGVGLPSTGYGGGGGSAEGTSLAGGAGGAAVVIVWEYK